MKNSLRFWSMTISFLLASVCLGLAGYRLDGILKLTFPIFTLLGIFAGLIAGVYRLLKELNNTKK